MKNVTPFHQLDYAGGKISRRGIYRHVPIMAYHHDLCAGPSISSGGLRKIEQKNAEHFYKSWYGNPDRIPDPDKKAYAFGRAVHLLFGGESGFSDQFTIQPDTYPDGATYPALAGPAKPWHGGAKWCKAWDAEQATGGKSILTGAELIHIRGMAEKLASHPTIRTGLLTGLVERSIVWRKRIKVSSGNYVDVWLKARPDNIPTESLIIADLKTCEDAGPEAVRRAIYDHGYHQQLALAQEGIFAVTGRVMTDFILVFQEKTPPYSINIKPVEAAAIGYGHLLNQRALLKFAEGLDTGVWDGYDDDEVPAGLPKRALLRLDYEVEQGLLPPIDPNPDYPPDEPEPEEGV